MKRVIACDLLTSSSKPRHFRKKTYVGFTVDPDRRVQEHNGLHHRGALYTENFRPWLPVCVVLGFKSYSVAQKWKLPIQMAWRCNFDNTHIS
jgi:structure-specific endonuclease subunit SLX1